MNARYYVPGVGRFASADSLVPNSADPQSFNRYSYVYNNPLNATDPSGHFFETVWDAANIVVGAGSLGYNLWHHNWGDAAWDAGGLLLDVGATAIPFVPGGAATAIKAGRTADNVVDAVNAIDNITDAVRAVDNSADALHDTTRLIPNPCSFSAKTKVTTLTGLRPIAEVVVGEYVLAYDETTGETGFYPVLAVWSHLDAERVFLEIDGEWIETTSDHPFYSAEGEWISAGELKIGDAVRNALDEIGLVQAVVVVSVPQMMYNFTVSVAHTYFVGEGQWLVHNDCPIPDGIISPNQLKPSHRIGGRGSTKRVISLAEEMKLNGFENIPPVKVIQEDSILYLVDGHHRRAAAQLLDKPVPFNIVDDSWLRANTSWSSRTEVVFDAMQSPTNSLNWHMLVKAGFK